jgi:hypothetical protein
VGNPSGINGRARQQIGPEKEAPVACTFEDRENARAGRLTPRNTRDASARALIQLNTSDLIRAEFGVDDANTPFART